MRSAILFGLLAGLTACDDSRRTQDTEATHRDRVTDELKEPQTRPNANAPAIGGELPVSGANPDTRAVHPDAGAAPNTESTTGNTTSGTGAARHNSPAPVSTPR